MLPSVQWRVMNGSFMKSIITLIASVTSVAFGEGTPPGASPGMRKARFNGDRMPRMGRRLNS